jgi:type VI protein secretion system component Hcp
MGRPVTFLGFSPPLDGTRVQSWSRAVSRRDRQQSPVKRRRKMKNAIERLRSVGLVLLLWVTAVAVLPTVASAQDQTFMLVPGIPGSSLDAHHPNWIDVKSLQQTFNATTRKHNACEIEIGKGLDVAGPRLWAAAVTSQLFAEIRIEVWGGTVDRRVKIYEIRLGNARITGIVTTGEQTFAESVTIKATDLNLSFFTQNPDGTSSTVTNAVDCD